MYLLDFPLITCVVVLDFVVNYIYHRQKYTILRHHMETFSALLARCADNSSVTGAFPSKKPVTRSFAVFADLHLNKRLFKQFWGWWFETPSRSLWRHCNAGVKISTIFLPSVFANLCSTQYTHLSYSVNSWCIMTIHYCDVIMGVSNHQPHDCLFNRNIRRRSKKTSKLRVTGLCAGNSPVPSYAENISIWWRHHALISPNTIHPCTMWVMSHPLIMRTVSKAIWSS